MGLMMSERRAVSEGSGKKVPESTEERKRQDIW
jgi:hypothetical protein